MSVTPTSESVAKATFIDCRTANSVVVANVASRCGWLICTTRNSAPPATAERPAARVRVVVVMGIRTSCLRDRGRSAADRSEGRKRLDDRASPDDVTHLVRSSGDRRTRDRLLWLEDVDGAGHDERDEHEGERRLGHEAELRPVADRGHVRCAEG